MPLRGWFVYPIHVELATAVNATIQNQSVLIDDADFEIWWINYHAGFGVVGGSAPNLSIKFYIGGVNYMNDWVKMANAISSPLVPHEIIPHPIVPAGSGFALQIRNDTGAAYPTGLDFVIEGELLG